MGFNLSLTVLIILGGYVIDTNLILMYVSRNLAVRLVARVAILPSDARIDGFGYLEGGGEVYVR